jgi:hypothetical protein
MKYIITGLVGVAIATVAQHIDMKCTYSAFKSDSPNSKLSITLMHLLWELRHETRKCDQFYRLM